MWIEEAAMAVVSEPTSSDSDDGYISAAELNRRMLQKRKQLNKDRDDRATSKGAFFDVYGAEAKAEVILHPPALKSRVTLRDLQGLVRWVLADGENPKWVFVKNKPLVSKVVMLHIPGLDAALYTEHPALFKSVTQFCGNPRATVGVGPLATPAQTVESLFSCIKPPTKKRPHPECSDSEEEQVETLNRNLNGGHKNPPSFAASYYILTSRQMHENGYPKVLDGEDIQPGFVKTLPAAANVTPLEIVAVDCEMCYTRLGLELTRVSMVSSKGDVLLDKLVKPVNPITNYNTIYSGITAEMMADVTRSLAEVQEEVLSLVHAETILVGHSVENDLVALKIVHPLVIDTALLYHHPTRGHRYKPALRVLTRRYLKRGIQGDEAGHDSVEDARAALDLALLKISKGPGFGKSMKPNCENLMEVLGRHGCHSSLIDRRPMLHQYAVGSCNAVIANSDEEVCAKAVKEVKKTGVGFVWAQLTDLNAYYEERARGTEDWSTRMAEMAAMMTCNLSGDSKQGEAGCRPLPEGLQLVLARLDDRFQQLYDALEPNTLLIVATGHGDTSTVRQLQELKWKSRQAGSEKWTRSNQDVLEEFAARAEITLVFTCMK